MLGACYYPEHWSEHWWEDDARRMRELGIAYVRIGEFAWSAIEPAPGQWNWTWLDRAMDLLGRHGLKIVLGTPTCTPPKWLIDAHPEIVPIDRDGKPRGFGSRRHTSFSVPAWHAASDRIVEAMARRYGEHPALVGWQTDNEYGCHDTILSFSPTDLAAFRDWLRRRYQDPRALNEAWGNRFWSMEIGEFGQISLPNLTVTEANPAAWLDFWRFTSEQVVAFNRRQVEIIRAWSPGRWITHNFMGLFHDFDHWAVGADLDLASWDSYPCGFVERFPFSEAERNRWALTSHPDMAAFHHDLYRGVGRGRWWVMEQQPGPVNWAPWNPVPAPGMVRLWSWEALAHGAEVVCYFRWRQAPFAQEQMHAGLNLPDRTLSVGGREAGQVARELATLGPLPESRRAPVALVFDYEASWITRIQPQGRDFNYTELTYRWYEAVRRRGLDVDFVPPGHPLDGYALVLVPTLPYVDDRARAALAAAPGAVLFGPRTASKTRTFQIPEDLPPDGLLPLRVLQVASLRPGLAEPVTGEVAGAAIRWREWLDTALPVRARFADGYPALVGDERRLYLGCWPDATLLAALVELLLPETPALPDTIRLRRRGDLTFAFNYGETAWQAPAGRFVLGGPEVAPRSLAAWRD